MKKINIAHILDILMEFSLLGIVFLMPVYFAFFLDNNNIFELNKLILFKILTSLFLVSFLARWFFSPFSCSSENLKRKSKYLFIPILFLLTMVLATLFSQLPELSFWGSYTRQQGLITFLYFFVFFVLSIFYINTSTQIKRILKVVGYSSFLVSLYGIFQVMGWDHFIWVESPQKTGRAFSSLGQPNYLGSYLMLVIPIVTYLYYIAERKGWQIFWSVVLVSNLVCLYFTGSRAAYLGLLVGVITAAVTYFFLAKPHKKIRQKRIILLVAGVVLCILVGAAISNSSFSGRVTRSFDLDQGSVAARWEMWNAASEAIKNSPWLGYGLETQRQVFFPYYEKEWGLFSNADIIPNRAHNFILDKVLTAGIIGFFGYLALLYLFFQLIWQNIRKESENIDSTDRGLSVMIIFALVSYLVSIFFHFEIIVTYVYFWLYLALIVVVHDRKNINKKEGLFFPNIPLLGTGIFQSIKSRLGGGKMSTTVKVAVILLLVVGFGLQLQRQLDYLRADHYYTYMNMAQERNDYFRVFELYDYIKQLNINIPRRYERDTVLIGSSFIDGSSEKYKEYGLKIIRDPLQEMALSSRFQDIYVRAQAYTALADQDDQKYFEMAKKDYRSLIEESPERSKHYVGYAKMWAKKGKYDKALENYEKARESLPSLDDPRINKEHSQTVKYKKHLIRKGEANIYFSQQEYQKAEEHYRLALENNPSAIVLYKKIADTYYKRGELDRAIEYNQKGYILSPHDPSWPFSIALLYKKKGEDNKALQYGEKALELAPEDKQLQEFVEKLK